MAVAGASLGGRVPRAKAMGLAGAGREEDRHEAADRGHGITLPRRGLDVKDGPCLVGEPEFPGELGGSHPGEGLDVEVG